MNKILPYPWQHPEYDEITEPAPACLFCIERADEAGQHGLPNVEKAWKSEMIKHIPALLNEADIAERFTAHANAIWNAAFPDEIDDWEYGAQLERCVKNEIDRLQRKVKLLETMLVE